VKIKDDNEMGLEARGSIPERDNMGGGAQR
jgi:hypothetical protein